jgi:DNA-binding MarR family transcriptional regulator
MTRFIEQSASGTAIRNPLDDLLGYQLRRASAAMLADLAEALGDFHLRPTEVSVLLLIEANPDITQSEIGRVLGVKRANMAPITATLTERGLIERAQANGRSQALRLSADGAAMAMDARARIHDHEDRFFGKLPDSARAALLPVLRSIWNER